MSTVSGQKRKLQDPHPVVEEIFAKATILPTASTTTKSGWCLREGLTHVLSVDNGRLVPVVQQHGIPLLYGELLGERVKTCRHENPDGQSDRPQNCFQSLCRIVGGQQLAGAAARTIWLRLLDITDRNLTPDAVLDLASKGWEEHLQKPAKLSKAKARSIIALAEAFKAGENRDSCDKDSPSGLSEEFLTTAEDDKVREALLAIRGIGPWSCDMLMMFYLERSNILPLGDLGVRKGIAKLFQLRGKGKNGSLCQKKDAELIEKTLAVYQPYTSLVSYYMWKVADTKDFYNESDAKKSEADIASMIPQKSATPSSPTTPKKARTRRKIARQVTP